MRQTRPLVDLPATIGDHGSEDDRLRIGRDRCDRLGGGGGLDRGLNRGGCLDWGRITRERSEK